MAQPKVFETPKSSNTQKEDSHPIKVKELRLNTCITDHDLSHKVDHLKTFLSKGYHVQLNIRGREDSAVPEGQYPEKKKLYEKVFDQVKNLCKLQKAPKYDPTSVSVTFIGNGPSSK